MGTDAVFAVIAEGTRRQILETLRDGDRAVGELVIELSVSQPTVSKHLKVLREAGLVTMRAQGQKRYYSLDTDPLGHLRAWLDGFTDPTDGSAVVGPGADDPGRPSTADTTAPSGSPSTDPGADLLAAAVLAALVHETEVPSESDVGRATVDGAGSEAEAVAQGTETGRPIGRTMGRAAERAADLLSQLRRRRDPTS